MNWTLEQQCFLNEFYQGVTDPDTKISMLIQATGGGTVSFHATELDCFGALKSISDSEILITQKIACLEYDLLVFNGLLKPELY
jgi:hypothetical protein